MNLKSLYVRAFPPTTVRRFIVDQTISWGWFFTYYLTIITTIIGSILTIFYLIGAVTLYYFQFPLHKGPCTDTLSHKYIDGIVVGLIVLSVTVLVIMVVGMFVAMVVDTDYYHWERDQEKFKEELENGIFDVEVGANVPIKISKFQRLNYKVFPPATIRRYIARIILYTIIIIVFFVLDYHLSMYLFPFNINEKVVKFILSLIAQVIIFLISLLIYLLVEPSCSKDWNKFKSQRESATTKK